MTIPTQPPNTTANPNRLMLLGALGGAAAVVALVVAVLIGYWLGRTSEPNSVPPTISATTPPSLLPPVITDPINNQSSDTNLTSSLPIPTDPALAAEEIDRHNDQQQQLTAQKQTLSQQVTDSNQLIELKAEQIRLLEAELAKQP